MAVSKDALKRRLDKNKGSNKKAKPNPFVGNNGNAQTSNTPAPNPNAPVGQGGRFQFMVQNKGMSPALAAYVGRKKLGKKKFQKIAAKGK